MLLILNIKIAAEIPLGWVLIQHTTVNKHGIKKVPRVYIFINEMM